MCNNCKTWSTRNKFHSDRTSRFEIRELIFCKIFFARFLYAISVDFANTNDSSDVSETYNTIYNVKIEDFITGHNSTKLYMCICIYTWITNCLSNTCLYCFYQSTDFIHIYQYNNLLTKTVQYHYEKKKNHPKYQWHCWIVDRWLQY